MSVAATDRLERRLARLCDGRDWSGYFAIENAEAVAERIRSMIGDGQRYTFVVANEYFAYRPEVRTSEVARDLRVSVDAEPNEHGRRYAHIGVVDSWSWGLLTEAETEAAARDGRERDQVRVTFGRRQLAIEHFAPAGNRLFWTVALEDEEARRG